MLAKVQNVGTEQGKIFRTSWAVEEKTCRTINYIVYLLGTIKDLIHLVEIWFCHQWNTFLFNISSCHVLIYYRKERTSDEHICCAYQTNLGSSSYYRTPRFSQDFLKCNRDSVKMTSCQEQDFFFVQELTNLFLSSPCSDIVSGQRRWRGDFASAWAQVWS